MDYKKKSLSKMNRNESYEEIDSRLASGWYVDEVEVQKQRNTKPKRSYLKFQKSLKLLIRKFFKKILFLISIFLC